MLDLNKIYNVDLVEGMRLLSNNSIDLTVTSPPYDNLRKYNGFDWNFEETAKELYRITKNGGVVVWVVGDATIKGSETGTSFKQALFFKSIGFNLHDTMIWQKTNPMPKVKTKRYFDVFEYMFVFSKGQPKTFSPLLVDCKFGGKTYNSTCKNIGGENGRTKKEFILNNKRYANNIWQIAIAQNKTSHPAVFPLKLALELNRRFIGFEISKEYCEMANERLKGMMNEDERKE